MFNSIAGILAGRNDEAAFVLTGGVEWEIAMPAGDLASLGAPGRECRVLTWLYHREDAVRLFGFADETRRGTFLELLKVEGIGPKAALKIMGGISQAELEGALESGNLARLEAVPGLGKKTAQKMLLALKGKLVQTQAEVPEDARHSDLVLALAEMGYDRRAAALALAGAEADLPAGTPDAEREKLLFKAAIVRLSGGS